MTPPPIRYPLPTLALVVLLGVAAWWGRGWIGAVGAAVRSGIDRVASGPPVPASTEPQRLAGPIVRKVLLLREGIEATDVPGGRPVETIGRRIFADVYDAWPIEGEPSHYRVGNRRPIGWVEAADVLPWDTRLVVMPSGGTAVLRDEPGAGEGTPVEVDRSPMPIVGWEGGSFRVAAWTPGEAWRRIERMGWVDGGNAEEGTIGVLLNRFELLELLRGSIDPSTEGDRSPRVRAVLGRLGEGGRLDEAEIRAVLDVLPAVVRDDGEGGGEAASDRLGRINDSWEADATWSGIEYRAIPLDAIPMH